MTKPTLEFALEHHQAGRLAQAEEAYRQILAEQPDDADALHLMGVLAGQLGRPQEALSLIRRAIALEPDVPDYYANLVEFLRRTGDLDQALAVGRKAIELAPDSATAQNNVGMVLSDQRAWDAAIAAFSQAVKLNPNLGEAHSNLGNALREVGKLDQAIAACRRGVELMPQSAGVHNNLGIALQRAGQLDAAVASFRRAAQVQPNLAEAHGNLGNALREMGQFDDAITACRRAVELRPTVAEAQNSLGLALKGRGRLDEAIAAFGQALRLDASHANAHTNLGTTLCEVGRIDEGVVACRRAVELLPGSAQCHNNLGVALKRQGEAGEALAAFGRALELKPDWADIYANLGNLLREMGRAGEAITALDQAMALKPDAAVLDSNRVFTLWFDAALDTARILAEHAQWARRHADPLAAEIRPHANDRTPDRRLRIGYVSPDFRSHSVGGLLVPLFSHHDPARVEVFCYSDVKRPDALTRRLRQRAHAWRETAHISDAALAEQIRADRIDVLVDLSLHTADNRLLAFARKPAPVQVTWLGYPGTTGLSTIDYRLSDPYLDPPGQVEHYSERTWRLPHCFWCYQPIINAPDVNVLPALRQGFFTFGCFNNFAKVSRPAQQLWVRILRGVPQSRLLIYAPTGDHRQDLHRLFESEGVARQRVEFVPKVPHEKFFGNYHRVDLCLDPFPFAGGTTSLDGLWMGVPMVTLAGQTVAGRGGVTLLSNLGLTQLIANTAEDYLAIAMELVNDLPRLADLRSGLRRRMQESSLTNGQQFAMDMEAAFRQMWIKWCGTPH